MNVIQEPNNFILNRFGNYFKYSNDARYRLQKYIILSKGENGRPLVYNCLTKELVELTDGDNLFSEYFLKHLFIVPTAFREDILAMMIRNVLESQLKRKIIPLGYTILTTTACNARCFYCYEKNDPKKPMSEKTALDVAEFIARNYNKIKENNEGSVQDVALAWFGGEPLFRKKCINIICERLKELGVPYRSSMISNGYLFDEKTVNEAKNIWGLKNVQITIDGTKDVYNKTKSFIYKNDNPFETIMENIKRLSENGIFATIRINVGKFNAEDAEKLICEIADRFSGNKFIKVYLHSLFDEFNSDIKTEDDDRYVFEKMERLENSIEEKGLRAAAGSLSNSCKSSHCMADSGRHLCILTDGRLTLCEHYTNSNVIGTIYDFPNNVDWELVDRYKRVLQPYDRCYGCPLITDCSILKICADNDRSCTSARQRYKINRKTKEIEEAYKKWKKSPENNKSEE